MQFELINQGNLRITRTRTNSYRDRLFSTAIFLKDYLVHFNPNSHEHNYFVRSVCALLPFLLCCSNPFLGENAPHNDNGRQRERIARLALYCGVGISTATADTPGTVYLETTRGLKRHKRHTQRSRAAAVSSYTARLQTPLLYGQLEFEKFLRVWTRHLESVVERSVQQLTLGHNLNLELVHLGYDLMDLVFCDQLHNAYRLSRIALRFNNIYGESIAMDVIRLAHFPRNMYIQNGESYFSGSQIQKELQGGETS